MKLSSLILKKILYFKYVYQLLKIQIFNLQKLEITKPLFINKIMKLI